MSKESYERGLGKVYAFDVSEGAAHGTPRRLGKTARDRLSGQHSRNLANRQERSSRTTARPSPGKKRG